ncbi:tRNA (adenosine(37)-N6)-threonylcarbamoyltransferase complex dimerization subunit type 1 TsaB [Deinococcus pimensis]|uniref:tRNA (adenosine(37)-N6)-threonylcarbamoyltransferase complex dimerization subunit type 1 TsaB n=1 Tax=Deinococcus pimensis TaxID=309888 RepID=UPI0004B0F8B8|nr:tRNA (adenosine(37)-N6)-threonylcarbamoyltransferase complex dimerization subunit type 1 TsaB [Deinococcus pimensis]
MILAVDTATPSLVLGLLGTGSDGQAVALERSVHVERAHAERLADTLEGLLDEAGRPRVDLVVVGTGPGSYTGLRVGASHALGLGRAWSAPVVGVPTLEAVAARTEGRVAVSLDARKGQVYGAVYDVSGGVVTNVVHPPEKRAREAFEELTQGLVRLDDEPPGGVALARLGLPRGVWDWQLQYA